MTIITIFIIGIITISAIIGLLFLLYRSNFATSDNLPAKTPEIEMIIDKVTFQYLGPNSNESSFKVTITNVGSVSLKVNAISVHNSAGEISRFTSSDVSLPKVDRGESMETYSIGGVPIGSACPKDFVKVVVETDQPDVSGVFDGEPECNKGILKIVDAICSHDTISITVMNDGIGPSGPVTAQLGVDINDIISNKFGSCTISSINPGFSGNCSIDRTFDYGRTFVIATKATKSQSDANNVFCSSLTS